MKVARKELTEMARDKRVKFGAFVMPIFLVLMMVQLFGFIIGAAKGAVKSTVYFVGEQAELAKTFQTAGMTVKTVPTIDEGVKLIKAEQAKLVLAFKPPTADGQIQIEGYYDPKQQMAQIALSGIQQALAQQNKLLLVETLKSKSIPEAAAEHVKLIPKPVEVGQKGAGELIVGFLPYLIVLFAFSGGMSMASDLVAGEKDKNTLETLLISPVGRNQIVLGKVISLAVVCFLSSFSCVVGLVLASVLKLPGSEEMFKNGFGVTGVAAGTIILLQVPMVIMFASVLIAISTFARNPREAQTYLALVNFIVIMPAVFSQVIGLTDLGSKLWINAVPVLNSANNIRNALLGKTDWLAVSITFGVSAVLAAIAIWIAVYLFSREEVLIRI
ncbi:MAG: ABC transporter permease subunit [Fimbriimonas sp.]|nr:ABC transporter permease subunit [Fimbriimonas sp.]